MLAALPVATDSPLQRLLTRKLLLTRSPPPPGKGTQSFNALRIRKLLEAGMLKEAAAIATNVRVKDDLVTARVQADALLLAGRDEVACGDATAARLQSADEYWIELRAFCYALTNDSALDLTRSVIESQNFQDAAFDAALDAMTGGKPKAPDAIATPSALHLRMFERLKWPVPSVAADAVGLPGVLLALRSPGTPLAAKVALAHDAFDAGVLSGADLAAALDLISFKPQELGAAAAQARGEEPMRGLALIRTALRDENDSDRRAELLSTGLRIGAQNDMFASASDLFGGDATTLVPRPDWDNWSFIMASGLLLAGHADAAEQWSNLIDRAQPKIGRAHV